MFRTKVVEKTLLCPVIYFRKLCFLWDNVKRYCTAGQATDGNMVHTYFMQSTQGYKRTRSIFNTCCCSVQQWLHVRVWMLRFTYMACLVNCIQIRVTWILCRIQTKIEIGLSVCLTTTTEFWKEFDHQLPVSSSSKYSWRCTTAVKKMGSKYKLIWIREANCYNLAYEVLPAVNIYFISILSVVWMGLEGPGSLLWKLTRKKAEEDISIGGIKWVRKTQQRGMNGRLLSGIWVLPLLGIYMYIP